ncbi:DUF1501 domain-containing protein [soil metagenome]
MTTPINAYTRREFVQTGLVLASASLMLPSFLQRSAFAFAPQQGLTSIPGVPEERVLVVIQLSGGNDGLNTVIPYEDANYYKARPGIGIQADKVLKLGKSGVGLHPAMTGVADLFNDGALTLVQGVGYPNPNRSHFKSMDIWHTASPDASGDGWLGRYFDSECCGFGKGESGHAEAPAMKKDANQQIGIALGREAPLAMKGRVVMPISFETPDLFRWTGRDIDPALGDPYAAIAASAMPDSVDPDSNAGFLTRTALDAQVSSATIRKAVATKPRVTYPDGDLARQLSMVASMISAGLKTRVYYVSLGGFDTHSGQGGENGRHANLLRGLGQAMKAFYADLKAQGNDNRVLTMTFSEFGRRVGQNASQGTDHGTAAPLFLAGPMVKPGVFNAHPSLTDLDSGDLKYTVDFRSIYSAIVADWMKGDPKRVLDGTFAPAKVLRV